MYYICLDHCTQMFGQWLSSSLKLQFQCWGILYLCFVVSACWWAAFRTWGNGVVPGEKV